MYQCENYISLFSPHTRKTCFLQIQTLCSITEFMNLKRRVGYFIFCWPCHSFLGHWENWMLGWAWDVLNEGSPHHHSHVYAGACVQLSKRTSTPNPKGTYTHTNLSDTHLTLQFMSLTQHTHSTYRISVSAVKSSRSLPAVSYHVRGLSSYFVKASLVIGIHFTSEVFSLHFSSRAKSELQLSTLQMFCWSHGMVGNNWKSHSQM